MSWDNMNQYERQNACWLIDGYRINKSPTESDEQWFDRSKAECVSALRKRIAQVEIVSFANMYPKTKEQQP